jgi:CubicO group peptidase (beta-lactamase class C family)
MMPHLVHRILLPVLCLVAVVPSAGRSQQARVKDDLPITGRAIPRLKQLDQVMIEILREHHLPGASLAVAKDGRLVFASGYGWADVENRQPIRPSSRFNLASCSKPITAAAVMKLVDQGKLRLDDKAFALLDLKPPEGAKVDPRVGDITVRQLLHHAGGLVRGHGSLPQIARRFRIELPVTAAQAMAFNLDKPLLFTPGTDLRYSNLGFLALRLVVERASGQEYETFTAEKVLGPMGIPDAHLDLLEGYRPREVHRYGPDGKCHPGGHGEMKGCAGCWVLSTVDATRFMTSLDGSRGERVVSKASYQKMLAPLPSLDKKANPRHNGLGWDVVEQTPAGVLHSKNGGVAGISTWMEHLPNGVCWALFFNGNLKDEGAEDGEERPRKAAGKKKPWPVIREAIEKINNWPTIDLFETE